MKCLVQFDLEFDFKFEISDGINLVKFWRRTFLPARKARKNSGQISAQISEQISENISENISETNFTTFFHKLCSAEGWC